MFQLGEFKAMNCEVCYYSYFNRINPVKYPDAYCKDCSQEPHTTIHLFNCPLNPTHLAPSALRKDPVAAKEFFNLDS